MQDYEMKAYFGDFYEEYLDQANEMLESHDWKTIVNYMDDDLREEVHSELAPCGNLDFLLKYMMLHTDKYKDDFTI